MEGSIGVVKWDDDLSKFFFIR